MAHRALSEGGINVVSGYKANGSEKPGPEGWLIDSGPIKNESANKPGKKDAKGLGTETRGRPRKRQRLTGAPRT